MAQVSQVSQSLGDTATLGISPREPPVLRLEIIDTFIDDWPKDLLRQRRRLVWLLSERLFDEVVEVTFQWPSGYESLIGNSPAGPVMPGVPFRQTIHEAAADLVRQQPGRTLAAERLDHGSGLWRRYLWWRIGRCEDKV